MSGSTPPQTQELINQVIAGTAQLNISSDRAALERFTQQATRSASLQEATLQAELRVDQSNPANAKFWADKQLAWAEVTGTHHELKRKAEQELKALGGKITTVGVPSSAELVKLIEEHRLILVTIYQLLCLRGIAGLVKRTGPVDSRLGAPSARLGGADATKAPGRLAFEKLGGDLERGFKLLYPYFGYNTLCYSDMSHSGKKGKDIVFYRIFRFDWDLANRVPVVYVHNVSPAGVQSVTGTGASFGGDFLSQRLGVKFPSRTLESADGLAYLRKFLCTHMWPDYLRKGVTHTPAGVIQFGEPTLNKMKLDLIGDIIHLRELLLRVGGSKHAKDFSPTALNRALRQRAEERPQLIGEQVGAWKTKRRRIQGIQRLVERDTSVLLLRYGSLPPAEQVTLRKLLAAQQAAIQELRGMAATADKPALGPANNAMFEETFRNQLITTNGQQRVDFAALRGAASAQCVALLAELDALIAMGTGQADVWQAEKDRWLAFSKAIKKTLQHTNAIAFYVDKMPGAYNAILGICQSILPGAEEHGAWGGNAKLGLSQPAECTIAIGIEVGAKAGLETKGLPGNAEWVKACAKLEAGICVQFTGTLAQDDERHFRFDGSVSLGLKIEGELSCSMEFPKSLKEHASVENKAGMHLVEAALTAKVAAGAEIGLFKIGGSYIYEDQYQLAANWARTLVRAWLFLSSKYDAIFNRGSGKRKTDLTLEDMTKDEHALLEEIAAKKGAAKIFEYLKDRDVITSASVGREGAKASVKARLVIPIVDVTSMQNNWEEIRFLKEVRKAYKTQATLKWKGEDRYVARTHVSTWNKHFAPKAIVSGGVGLPTELAHIDQDWIPWLGDKVNPSQLKALLETTSVDVQFKAVANHPSADSNGLSCSIMYGKLYGGDNPSALIPSIGDGADSLATAAGSHLTLAAEASLKIVPNTTAGAKLDRDRVRDVVHKFTVGGVERKVREFARATKGETYSTLPLAKYVTDGLKDDATKRKKITDFSDKTAIEAAINAQWLAWLGHALSIYKYHFAEACSFGLFELGLYYSTETSAWHVIFGRIWRRRELSEEIDVGQYTGVPFLMVKVSGSLRLSYCALEVLGAETFSYLKTVYCGMRKRLDWETYWTPFREAHHEEIVGLLAQAGTEGTNPFKELVADGATAGALKVVCAAIAGSADYAKNNKGAVTGVLDAYLQVYANVTEEKEKGGWLPRAAVTKKALLAARKRAEEAARSQPTATPPEDLVNGDPVSDDQVVYDVRPTDPDDEDEDEEDEDEDEDELVAARFSTIDD